MKPLYMKYPSKVLIGEMFILNSGYSMAKIGKKNFSSSINLGLPLFSVEEKNVCYTCFEF